MRCSENSQEWTCYVSKKRGRTLKRFPLEIICPNFHFLLLSFFCFNAPVSSLYDICLLLLCLSQKITYMTEIISRWYYSHSFVHWNFCFLNQIQNFSCAPMYRNSSGKIAIKLVYHFSKFWISFLCVLIWSRMLEYLKFFIGIWGSPNWCYRFLNFTRVTLICVKNHGGRTSGPHLKIYA